MTDIAINSQTQSPLVRVLSSVDSAAGNFTHHVADNVPPVSFTEVELAPNQAWTPGNAVRIELPQLGYLEQIQVIFRWKVADGITTPLEGGRQLHVFELFDSASLQTRRKDLSRLYARRLRNSDVSSSLAQAVNLAEYSRFSSIPPVDGAWSKHIRDITGYVSEIAGDDLGARYEARWELPFAVLQLPAIQLQTLFVENMEVEIQTHALVGGSNPVFRDLGKNFGLDTPASSAFHDSTNQECVLRVRYRNFHDETENVIRNENYVSGTPATILSANCFQETSQPLSILEKNSTLTQAYMATVGNLMPALKTALSAINSPVTVSSVISSKNLAYGLSFGLGSEIGGARTYRVGWRLVEARLKGNGRILQSWSYEDLRRHMRQSFLKTQTPYSMADIAGSSLVENSVNVSSINHPSHPQWFNIQFGMQYGTAFNSGALGLASMSSVTLETDWVLDMAAYWTDAGHNNEGLAKSTAISLSCNVGSGSLWENQRVYVYVDHFNLLRIDPDNGAVTTSLDI